MSSIESSSGHVSARVVVAFDATKDRNEQEFKNIFNGIRLRGDILHSGDTLMVLGVLHKVLHPLGYHMKASPESFDGTHISALEEEVTKKVDMYVRMLLQRAEEYKHHGVDIEVKITAGTPLKTVVIQEITACNATWVILDRHFRRELRFYIKQIPCKVALILDNLSVEVLRPNTTTEMDNIEHKLVFSMCKPVPLLAANVNENNEQSVISIRDYSSYNSSFERSEVLKINLPSAVIGRSQDRGFLSRDEFLSISEQDKSGRHVKGEIYYGTTTSILPKQRKTISRQRHSSDAPVLCVTCGLKTDMSTMDSMRFAFSEIQLATNDFSNENLLGEGGYGHVYKGKLKDGQLIAAKVHKEESSQGFREFHSEVHVLSFARHKNIVMLLGYCCKENLNILVYEYICNKSLDWHLFDDQANVLEWHQRHAIAIGTAKGLRFLHEECRGSPIIHRDMRPSNILLTHDFVPMLGDFGLAKWKTSDDPVQTRIIGTFGYLAPEYAENGIVSVRTDVYAYGIVLIQLMSGRKVFDSTREDQQHSLRQWVEPLIERLALHELIDPRIQNAYDTFELYHMARTAYLCVQTNPEMRPSMAEVLRLLEGENDHLHHLAEQIIPHFTK